jgi:prevent-host-death family protein
MAMLTVNMHDAKTQLSKLVAMAVQGKPFIIAKAGKPLVKVEAVENLEIAPPPLRGMGALRGQFKLPDDFSLMDQLEIEDMFYNGRIFPDC